MLRLARVKLAEQGLHAELGKATCTRCPLAPARRTR
jgi:hypothetical protein